MVVWKVLHKQRHVNSQDKEAGGLKHRELEDIRITKPMQRIIGIGDCPVHGKEDTVFGIISENEFVFVVL
jgi:hypothetical protein